MKSNSLPELLNKVEALARTHRLDEILDSGYTYLLNSNLSVGSPKKELVDGCLVASVLTSFIAQEELMGYGVGRSQDVEELFKVLSRLPVTSINKGFIFI